MLSTPCWFTVKDPCASFFVQGVRVVERVQGVSVVASCRLPLAEQMSVTLVAHKAVFILLDGIPADNLRPRSTRLPPSTDTRAPTWAANWVAA